MDFQLFSTIVTIELDGATGWVKATRTIGEVVLIQPRDALALMTWSQENTQTLIASQQAIDQEASLYANSVQGQARPVRLVDPLPAESTSSPKPPAQKRKRRQPLPLPNIQMSQALPCLLRCKTTTMTALVDFGAGPHAPWQLYPFCEEHLRLVLSEREASCLSLRALVEMLTRPAPSS